MNLGATQNIPIQSDRMTTNQQHRHPFFTTSNIDEEFLVGKPPSAY